MNPSGGNEVDIESLFWGGDLIRNIQKSMGMLLEVSRV